MKKFGRLLSAVFVLCILTGCGNSYEADESTVFVLKDGSVVSTDVEDFDETAYDADALKSYIEETIASYNEENGEDCVKQKKLTVEDGKATLILSYASAADYKNFNDIDFYTGTVTDALAAGYSFDGTFASVADGTPTACSSDEFLGDADYKVVIIRSNTRVQVKGTIAYVSTENTSYEDKNTIVIKEGTNLLSGGTQNGTEAQETTEAQPVTETQEATESTGAVSEDELLDVTEESTQIVFDFDEDEETDSEDPAAEISQVYTYIIYK